MENKSNDAALFRLSDETLYGLYRPDRWRELNAGQRHALLQETVNREGERAGHGCRARVTLEPLPAGQAGQESRGRIVLNGEMALRDQLSARCGGRLITYRPPDMGYRMLETVLHEYRHAVQEDIILGRIPADGQTRLLLMANDTTVSVTGHGVVSQYLRGNSPGSYELYYLQPCELDAYRTSQTRTEEILTQLQERYGSDPAMEAYRRRMSVEGWQTHVTQANALYQCEDTPGEIAKTLLNAYTGASEPVSPAVERAVRAEMAASAGQDQAAAQYTPVPEQGQRQEANLFMTM